jgi:hypothetical protein
MTDAAEQWLLDNDPNYEKSRRGWADLDDDGVYHTPAQEIPWGLSEELELLVNLEAGEYVESSIARGYRTCENHRCGLLFQPTNPWHRFCRRACRQSAYRRRVTHS